ncbi:MAG: hypothetical protein KF813_00990 [Trueperaceae bacterium]|nr:hypothetical protein [Trueperaceae bacterium]
MSSEPRPLNLDVEVILTAQHANGAFPAGAEFSQYARCWLRDGSFIAHALDVAALGAGPTGALGSRAKAGAFRFHAWVAATLARLRPTVVDLCERRAGAVPLGEFDFLPARFTLDGDWERDGWPNFQLDGYGQWLWSLAHHLRSEGRVELPSEMVEAVHLVVRYLSTFWDQPCYDAWEEGRSQLHTATLASIHAGLRDIQPYLPPLLAAMAKAAAAGTLRYIRDDCVQDGALIKSIRNTAVDASLLWLSVPFDVYAVDDPVIVATAARIERELLGGGVRRYLADTYYGGGEWILLTAWLAWYWLRVGRRADAEKLMEWIEAQRGEAGALPEQVPGPTVHGRFLAFWKREWGPSAEQLLWSHAMVAIVRSELSV